jgi:hypothetical protein
MAVDLEDADQPSGLVLIRNPGNLDEFDRHVNLLVYILQDFLSSREGLGGFRLEAMRCTTLLPIVLSIRIEVLKPSGGESFTLRPIQFPQRNPDNLARIVVTYRWRSPL